MHVHIIRFITLFLTYLNLKSPPLSSLFSAFMPFYTFFSFLTLIPLYFLLCTVYIFQLLLLLVMLTLLCRYPITSSVSHVRTICSSTCFQVSQARRGMWWLMTSFSGISLRYTTAAAAAAATAASLIRYSDIHIFWHWHFVSLNSQYFIYPSSYYLIYHLI